MAELHPSYSVVSGFQIGDGDVISINVPGVSIPQLLGRISQYVLGCAQCICYITSTITCLLDCILDPSL